MKKISLFLLFSIIFSSLPVSAKPMVNSQLPDLQLASLMGKNNVNLKDYLGSVLFLSFFENECRWCLKQIREYNQLNSSGEARYVMAGVGENDFYLRHWANRASPQIPVVKAEEKLLDIVGEVKATPYTLIFDKKGRFVSKITGYIKQEKLQQIINFLNG